MPDFVHYFFIGYGSFRLLMITRKLFISNISDWECLAGGFWLTAVTLSTIFLRE